jgi:hypothetical protein
VASVPELYPDLLELNVVPTLVTLLQHENSDILADVIELLSELTGAGAPPAAVRPAGACMPRLPLLGCGLPAGLEPPLLPAPPPAVQTPSRATRRRRGCWWSRCCRTAAWSCWCRSCPS